MASLEAPLEYSFDELLESGEYAEPLMAGDVLCHGGFNQEGVYRSPRILNRKPAILAWQQSLQASGGDLIQISPDLIPPQYPSVDQSVLLCRNGVREPVVRALTVISVVEGFGAVIRDVKVPDLASWVVEPIQGTALSHLRGGLFEAHARDEAGWGEEGGHKQMWEAARDLAFEKPEIPPDVLMRIMGGPGKKRRERKRLFPELDETLESMVTTMCNVLIVELFADEVFRWGKSVLSNSEISAEPERAAAMVGYIQSDENPHVEYLRTALSELASRTLKTVDGKTLAGKEVVDGMLHALLGQMIRTRPADQKEQAHENLSELFQNAANPSGLKEEFLSLEQNWSPPERTGFEPQAAACAE
ncbi:MAG: hypothetical protein CL917_14295 [Deltaproteobacteria bacterium]|nr:hypothetical protein [Deltaproteobacteria bacterium]